MKKSALGIIAVATAVAAATAACSTSGKTANAPISAALAGQAFDLSAPGGPDAAMAAPLMDTPPAAFGFRTVDDAADPTFNQLLGINDAGVIAGYFGSGAAGHPNKGFVLHNRMKSFTDENFPKAVQTQVTGINDVGATVGFWSKSNNDDAATNDNTGFVAMRGTFHSVAFPTKDNASPPVNQLLGINNDGLAVGFYNDAAGNAHGYTYNTDDKIFNRVNVNGATSVTATAINDRDQIAGFDTNAAGATEGFLRGYDGSVRHLTYPNSSGTQAFGVSDRGEVVGSYTVGTGTSQQMHGFTWTAKAGFKSVDDPNGVGATTINGVNDAGVLVGFYVDAAGNTHGMVAKPGGMTTPPSPTPSAPATTGTSMPSMPPTSATGGTSMPSMSASGSSSMPGGGSTTEQLNLSAMPTGKVAVTQTDDGHYRHYQAAISATGFTPGSSHLVEIDAPGAAGPVVRFGAVQADGQGVIHTTVTSTDSDSALPYGARFVIRLGANTGDFNRNQVAAEPIAQSDALPSYPTGSWYGLNAVNVSPYGDGLGQLSGTATVAYNASAQTLTVTVNATGLGAGNHAAHIHAGTCQSQGKVLYMLMDFTADANGNVVNETRTATGVTSIPAMGTWYLNLHEGDSNTILMNGSPALSFRPLLCANG